MLNSKKCVAIVGSRNCSEYGRKFAKIFAEELAKYGVCVVSGLAKGVDAAAHFGATYEVGRTIAVLGGGLNDVYPKENMWLFNDIISNGGCIISEHNPNERTETSNFPKRNRIISGLSDAVLVVESEAKSGSTITARYAKEQGKKIFCIPSNLDSKVGAGTNNLIRNGAIFVTQPNQIIDELYGNECNNLTEIFDKKIEKNNIHDNVQMEIVQIPKEYKAVYEILKKKELSSDEMSRLLNMNIGKLNSILTMMELEGYVVSRAGNIFTLRQT